MDERTLMASRIARLARPRWRSPDVRDVVEALRERLVGSEEKRRRLRRWALIGGPPALLGAALGAWLLFGPTPQPDYRRDSLRKVFDYTLLTEEFNRLPVEKRLELIGLLVGRLKNMSAGDSALMAAFAAGIAGAAREQLERNASTLAIDVWDMYAREYAQVPEADREAFLDQTFIEFTKMMETVAGETRDVSDAERLAEGHRQAKRDQEMMSRGRGPSGRMMGRLFGYMRDNVGSHASPAQRTRGMLMMRDMVRRLRGEDGPG